MVDREPVYITGHQHPDTDSVVSAIAYAFFKRARDGIRAVPCRLGELNHETEYLLKRFGFEVPELLEDARKTLSEIELDAPESITPEMSMLETVRRMDETERPSFAVVDQNQKVIGLVSKSDLANIALRDTASEIELLKQTDIYHIAESINGTILYDEKETHVNGKVSIISLSTQKTANYDVRDRIVIIGDDPESQLALIRGGAGILIIVWAENVREEVLEEAKKYHCPIIRSGHGSMNTSRYLYLAPPVKLIMRKPEVFRVTDLAEEAGKKFMKTRIRSYPVLDAEDRLCGYLHRYHIMNYRNKKIILVDHNEFSQSVKAIEKAQILEVIDHHRINDFATTQPVSFRNEIVGSTATIVTTMFRENQIPLPENLAGLLLGAVLSDTLNYQSPTTTRKDREVGNILAAVANLDQEEFARDIFTAAADEFDRPVSSMIRQDIKYYEINGCHTMISQALVSSLSLIPPKEKEIQEQMNVLAQKKELDLLAAAFTSVIDNGSVMFFAGEKAQAALEAFPNREGETHSFQEGILSRKSQILPKIEEALGN
ncbi:MAG: putative manganese-dependent inorganic diphosphatase [Solobacterium sp.]|nr:putative manganese-dependent inorganic diphosphatase [Solobacterium sp.]